MLSSSSRFAFLAVVVSFLSYVETFHITRTGKSLYSHILSTSMVQFPDFVSVAENMVEVEGEEKGEKGEKGEKVEKPRGKGGQGQYRLKKGGGSKLNHQILTALNSNNKKESVNDIKTILKDSYDDLNHIHAVTLLHRSAKNSIDIRQAIQLDKVVEIMQRPNYRDEYTPQEVTQAVYGLRMFSEHTAGSLDIVGLVNSKIDNIGAKWFRGCEVANMLWGLQSFTTTSDPRMKSLLLHITTILEQPSTILTSQELSMGMYGLRKFKDNSTEIIQIVGLLGGKIEEMDGFSVTYTAQGVSNAFNGLQQLDSSSPEVRGLIKALIPKVDACPDHSFPSRSIGGIMMGLRSMDAATPEVQRLLRSLTRKVKGTKDGWKALTLTSSFNGLKNMNDEEPVVQELLTALADKIDKCEDLNDLNLGSISHLVSGLQTMSFGSQAVRNVIKAVAKSMQKAMEKEAKEGRRAAPVTSWDIGALLYGLQSLNFKTCPEVSGLLDKINKRIAPDKSWKLSSVHVGFSLYGLKNLMSTNPPDELRALLSTLTAQIAAYPDEKFSPQTTGMAMLGMKSSTSDAEEMRSVLQALIPRISYLDSQACGNCLFSMQRMDSKHEEVREMLSTLARAMSVVDLEDESAVACVIEGRVMTPQELANALYGLQNMDSKYPEVRSVVNVLNQRMESYCSTIPRMGFTAQGVGNAISGLQTMSNEDGPEIEMMLGFFADIVEDLKVPMKAEDVANCLFGLQGMKRSGESEQFRLLLAALVPKMKESEGRFTARDIGYCMSGMTNMQQYLYSEVDELIEELYIKVAESEYGGQANILFLQYGKAVRVKTVDPTKKKKSKKK